jgi:hypothetical protein
MTLYSRRGCLGARVSPDHLWRLAERAKESAGACGRYRHGRLRLPDTQIVTIKAACRD